MEGGSGAERATAAYSDARQPAAGREGLQPLDVAVVRELQEDVPLEPQPYAPMARRIGVSEEEFLAAAGRLRTQGYMRRMAGVLHHREAGYRANAMGVWVVPDDRAEEVGRVMATFKGVSHCYRRPTYPDWPYSVFHHGARPGRQGLSGRHRCHRGGTGITEYALLYSTREYKKIRLRYFTPELDEWEARTRRSSVPAGTHP